MFVLNVTVVLRETNLQRVQLEVYEDHWVGKVYARAGFVQKRKLLMLKTKLSEERVLFPERAVPVATPLDILAHSERLHGEWVCFHSLQLSLCLHVG